MEKDELTQVMCHIIIGHLITHYTGHKERTQKAGLTDTLEHPQQSAWLRCQNTSQLGAAALPTLNHVPLKNIPSLALYLAICLAQQLLKGRSASSIPKTCTSPQQGVEHITSKSSSTTQTPKPQPQGLLQSEALKVSHPGEQIHTHAGFRTILLCLRTGPSNSPQRNRGCSVQFIAIAERVYR